MTLLELLITLPLMAAVRTSMAVMKWDKRVLLVAASDGRDPALLEQRRIVAQWKAGAAERNLAVIEVVGDTVGGATDTAVQLRHRFKLPRNGFAIVLIGEDGGAKLRQTRPIPAAMLEVTIDAMPMRLRLELDVVLLAKGRFLHEAPNAPTGRWTRYLSMNATATF